MQILIIGANGGIGRQAVELALASGHSVTAVLRKLANLTLTHPRLKIVQGDVMNPSGFENWLSQTDLVISAIGGKMTRPTKLFSQGNELLIRAMKNKGVRRAFFISSSAIEISPVLPFYVRLAEKYIVQKILRHGYADQRLMEEMIKGSGLNWTIMRPPRLSDKPVSGHYRYAVNQFLKNALNISRADLAHFMLNHATDEETYHGVVEIGY